MHSVVVKKLPKQTLFQPGTPKNTTKTVNSGLGTGLYYYGARYLDPKTSRWISADPAIYEGDYIPSAPINDEARRRNGNLPGMGGIYNTINMHVYHYAGNNPVKLVDPDGRTLDEIELGVPADICDPDGNKIGEITALEYTETSWGALLRMGFIADRNPSDQDSPYIRYEWFQTLNTNALRVDEVSPRVDKPKGSDKFLYNALMYFVNCNREFNGKTYTFFYHDSPGRIFQDFLHLDVLHWQAEFSLVGIRSDGTMDILHTVSYGYTTVFTPNSPDSVNISTTKHKLLNVSPSSFHREELYKKP